jgi:hypothetical protein
MHHALKIFGSKYKLLQSTKFQLKFHNYFFKFFQTRQAAMVNGLVTEAEDAARTNDAGHLFEIIRKLWETKSRAKLAGCQLVRTNT